MESLLFFENVEVEVIMVNDEPLFELYGVGAALGYKKIDIKKGIEYKRIRKDRVDKVVKNAEIELIVRDKKKYININGVRKFISMSNTTNKSKFIDFLQEKEYLHKEEVFGYSRKENVLMDSLIRVLKPMGYTLETQKKDNGYRLDAYIPELDLVIEYDENAHAHYDLNKEYTREMYIKNNYSHLIRLTDDNDLMTNIGKIMNKIIEIVS